jgi:hypothetical protein
MLAPGRLWGQGRKGVSDIGAPEGDGGNSESRIHHGDTENTEESTEENRERQKDKSREVTELGG